MSEIGDFLSLSYGEVKRCVVKLPDAAIAELVLGPLPDQEGREEDCCRVCVALADHRGDEGPVDQLLEWHDLQGKTFDLVRLVAGVDDDQLTDECMALTGALSFARCTTIYALAELEAGVRLRRQEATRV